MSRELTDHALDVTGVLSLRWTEEGQHQRETREPGSDVSDLPDALREAAEELWTPEYVAAWKVERGIDQPPTSDEAMAAAVRAIQNRRARAIEAFSFMGQPVTLSSQTQQDIGNAIQGLGRKPEGSVIEWEIRDGVYATMDLPTLEAFGDAAYDHVQACFANSKALTQAAIAGEPYDLEAGWP